MLETEFGGLVFRLDETNFVDRVAEKFYVLQWQKKFYKSTIKIGKRMMLRNHCCAISIHSALLISCLESHEVPSATISRGRLE